MPKKREVFFKNDALKQFKYLCVYGEKGITAAEALKRDGRFVDDLGDFEVVNINDEHKTKCTDIIDHLDNMDMFSTGSRYGNKRLVMGFPALFREPALSAWITKKRLVFRLRTGSSGCFVALINVILTTI